MTASTHLPNADHHAAHWALASGREVFPLAENWSLCPVEEFQQGTYAQTDGTWQATTVPAHWQQHPDLEQHAGKMVYRCTFAAPHVSAATRVWLRVNGIFYWSQTYINGQDLGRHEGYFIPYEHDITHLLSDDNTLLIEVDCPDEHNKFGKRMLTGVFSHWDCLDPLANPGGIWLPIELVSSGAVRLHAVRCHTEAFNAQFAQLRYTAEIDATSAGTILLRWTIAPRTFEGPVQTFEQRRTVQAGFQELYGLLKLREPRLWWSHDLGNPDLYTITLEVVDGDLVSDTYRFSFGVRQFELRDWIPYLNGVRFLAKGSNYPPGDMRIATMTPERCAQDIALVRAGNMNMLRVHAHVDHPALYAAADAAGVLLWQDMPLQWLYHVSVLDEARRQARAMVHLLYNHPSVAIWCMHNEPLHIVDTSNESRLSRFQTYHSGIGFGWNRDVMDTQMKQVAEETDPTRPAVRSSGEFYIPGLRGGTDTHLYFGWYSAYGDFNDAEALRRRLPVNWRFVTEFGTQSFPQVESCIKFMPSDIAAIDFAHLAQRHGFQREIASNWLDLDQVESLQALVDMTQDYQIVVNRFYIDRLRYHKYRPTGGMLAFMFCDSYPAILWSVVDYWRVPKRSYAAMRTAFSPQYVFTLLEHRPYAIAEPIDLPIYVVNDAQRPVDKLHLTARLEADDTTTLAVVERTLHLDADCLAWEADRLRFTPTHPGRYTLALALTGGDQDVAHVYQIEVA